MERGKKKSMVGRELDKLRKLAPYRLLPGGKWERLPIEAFTTDEKGFEISQKWRNEHPGPIELRFGGTQDRRTGAEQARTDRTDLTGRIDQTVSPKEEMARKEAVEWLRAIRRWWQEAEIAAAALKLNGDAAEREMRRAALLFGTVGGVTIHLQAAIDDMLCRRCETVGRHSWHRRFRGWLENSEVRNLELEDEWVACQTCGVRTTVCGDEYREPEADES